MNQCVHHPQYRAIEHCEHCGVSLCGLCLWYAQSGERLCEQCAKQWQSSGHVVYEPEQFADGIQATLSGQGSKAEENAPYSGNSTDLAGFAAACLSAVTLLSCVPCLNMFTPLVGLLVGLLALNQAERAVNPRRTRTLAWIGIGGGALIALVGLAWVALTVGLPLMMLLIEVISSTNP